MPALNTHTVYLISLFLNSIFILFVIFAQRRNPAATWAWVMVMGLFPIGGFVIYLILGQDSRKHRDFMKKAGEDQKILDQYNDMEKGYGATFDNELLLFHEGTSKFNTLLEDIADAADFIFIQYYIFRGDEIGRHLLRQLTKKAYEGVDVRLLLDGMGCILTPKKIFKPLTDAGGQVSIFLPPVPVRINFRNHRKLVLIDGLAGYIGGSNIGNEYLGMTKRFGYWRDTHMRLTGSAVRQLTLRFMMDWNFASRDEIKMKPRYFPNQPDRSGTKVRIVSSGPDSRYPEILHGFCRMVMEARSSVYIQTPYFVPDESLFSALRIAALSGVDVRIMFPAHPDHPFVYWAGLSYLGELLETGVKCYEYEKGFIHSKTLMVDSVLCAIGTANMDVRSFKLNFETTAFIEDEAVARELVDYFHSDMKDCREITLESYVKRSKWVKIKESVSRLFSPLL